MISEWAYLRVADADPGLWRTISIGGSWLAIYLLTQPAVSPDSATNDRVVQVQILSGGYACIVNVRDMIYIMTRMQSMRNNMAEYNCGVENAANRSARC